MRISNTGNNVSFKGAVITPYGDNYAPPILNAKYRLEEKGGNRSVPLVMRDWSWQKDKEGNNLTLWGKDNDLFRKFIETHGEHIPALPEELGFEKGSSLPKANNYAIKATKLAQALTEVVEIPKLLTPDAIRAFIGDSKNLTQELLSPELLGKALEKIKGK